MKEETKALLVLLRLSDPDHNNYAYQFQSADILRLNKYLRRRPLSGIGSHPSRNWIEALSKMICGGYSSIEEMEPALEMIREQDGK